MLLCFVHMMGGIGKPKPDNEASNELSSSFRDMVQSRRRINEIKRRLREQNVPFSDSDSDSDLDVSTVRDLMTKADSTIAVAGVAPSFVCPYHIQTHPATASSSVCSSSDQSSEEMEEDSLSDHTYRKVVIIGAGIAGVAAGRQLNKSGITDFIILEATERTGGRIMTINLPEAGGSKVELGANWIHGANNNPVFTIANENGLLEPIQKLHERAQYIHILEDGSHVPREIVAEIEYKFEEWLSKSEEFYQKRMPIPPKTINVGSFIRHEFDEYLKKYSSGDQTVRRLVFQERMLLESIINGSDILDDVSLSEIGSYQELQGHHHVIPAGYQSVVDIMKKGIPPENILLDHPVKSVCWKTKRGKAIIRCENGNTFVADHVICTISLGCLKGNMDAMFVPLLPYKKRCAIRDLAIGTVDKVILRFEGQALPDGVLSVSLLWDRNELEHDLATRWVTKIQSFVAITDNILIGWLSGEEAEYMETLEEEEIGRVCVTTINRFLKEKHKLPKLAQVFRTKWSQNLYTRGSYSFIPCGTRASEINVLAEPVLSNAGKPLLLFAGEATHSEFYSTTHGALLSGQREADRLLGLLEPPT